VVTYTHCESTAEVIEDNPGAGVASVIHLEGSRPAVKAVIVAVVM
jgi:hypothetical protein